MKRFHVHVAVDNLTASIGFYSRLFGQSPAKQQPDYAKWMLDDPRLNFAISSRGHKTGVNHFGMQAETSQELAALRALADAASTGDTVDSGNTTCCYASSEKHWVTDPQGIAWEHFLTMADAMSFGEESSVQSGPCCVPLRASAEDAERAKEACCIPSDAAAGQTQCCS